MKNNYLLLFITVFALLITAFSFKHFLKTQELIYNFYSEQLAQEQVEKLIQNQEKWAWLGYAVIPLLVLIRSSLVAMCLSVGHFLCNQKYKI